MWKAHTELIQLGERDTAYLSKETILLERANELFGEARLNIEAAEAVSAIEWPMPPTNADGSQWVENAEPFDQIRWEQEEHFFAGDAEERMIPTMTVS